MLTLPMLKTWEKRFRKDIGKITESQRQKAGALLPVIPDREAWNEFLGLIKTFWKRALDDFPSCLIILYDGIAFYEYDANSFWPQFQTAVTTGELLGAEQEEINSAFARAAGKYDLPIQ